MAKEREAIEYLKESVLIYKNTIPKISESIGTVLSMLKEKDKQIDLMAERIEWLCKNFGILLDEEHDENFTQEDIKQYFESQVLNK